MRRQSMTGRTDSHRQREQRTGVWGVLMGLVCVWGAACWGHPSYADEAVGDGRPDLATLQANAEGISPSGRPDNYKLGDPARYFIWEDSGGWHLRATAPKGKMIGFRGTLRVHNGKVRSARPIGFDRGQDSAAVSDDQKELAFQFRTSNKFDGFDFGLEGGKDAWIEMELYVNGRKHADRVFVGAKAVSPQSHHFALPAR